ARKALTMQLKHVTASWQTQAAVEDERTMTMTEMTMNGTRKNLSSQIDRLEELVGDLRTNLSDAVAVAVKEVVGQAVKEAVREAVQAVVHEVFSNPDLALLFRGMTGQAFAPAPVQPEQSLAAS